MSLLLHRLLRRTLPLHHRSFPSFCSSASSPENPNPDELVSIVSYAPLLDEPPRRTSFSSQTDQEFPPELNAAPGTSSPIIPPSYEPFRPRVAPLPEDRAADEQQQQASVGPQRKWKPVEAFVSEDDLEIPVPSFVKVETRKRPDPITLMEAIRQVKAQRKARFDETVEAAVRLGVDPKRSDQLVRGAATLPHGTGKVVRVAVFAEGDEAEEAKSAGADVVGSDELVDMILQSGGKLDFDKCVATPSIMPMLSKVARILGPRGLMPNPKVGTVTKNVGNAVKHLKQGRVDFRADKTGIVHAGVGKVSFAESALHDNIAAFANAVLTAKPAGLKKTSKYAGYMLTFSICSTMGPGVRVTIPSISQAVDSYTKMMDQP